jgi:hypothetical protein
MGIQLLDWGTRRNLTKLKKLMVSHPPFPNSLILIIRFSIIKNIQTSQNAPQNAISNMFTGGTHQRIIQVNMIPL